MKKYFLYISTSLVIISFTCINSACAPKIGCPINEEAHVKVNKRGEMPTKRGKSNLFSKKTRRKMH